MLQADGWANSYFQRPREELELTESIRKQYGESRTIINLNGAWQTRREEGDSWTQVIVPGSYDFEGIVEFRRTFHLDSTFVGRAVYLVAYGINNRCTIFINDEFLGGHLGGHTSFSLEIERDKLKIGGRNEIRILVDNTLLPRNSLPLKHRSGLGYNYGGIFRDIFIMAAPPVHLVDLQVMRIFEAQLDRCQLKVNASIRNKQGAAQPEDKLNLHYEIWDSTGQVQIAKSDNVPLSSNRESFQQEVHFGISSVTLWTPENPVLYELRACLTQDDRIVDQNNLNIGFHNFEISENRFELNGHPYEIKGLDWYEDFANLGPTAGRKTIEKEILRMKELGANCLRVVGTPPHPFLLDICDKLGLLVFEEMPLILVPESRFQDPKFAELASNYFEEMLQRDARHASLVAWGLGRDLETQKPETRRFLRSIRTKVAKQTNQLTYLVARNFVDRLTQTSTDFHVLEMHHMKPEEISGLGELAGVNREGLPSVISYGAPLIVNDGENSSLNLMDEGGSKSLLNIPRSIAIEELQAHTLQMALKSIRSQRSTDGVLIHAFSDWRGARPKILFGQHRNPYLNRYGLMNVGREKRRAFELVQAVFANKKAPQITVRIADSQNPVVYPIYGIALILFFLYNFNRSRRLRGNLRRIFKFPHGFYTEIRENRKIPLGHTVFLSFVVSSVIAVVISSLMFKFRENLVFDEFLNLILVSDNLKLQLSKIIWEPLLFILSCVIVLYLFFILLVVLLRATSFMLGQRLPVSQFMTLTFWVAANFVWLLPVVPIYYRIIDRPDWTVPAIWLLILFVTWSAVRLFRSIKVIFVLNIFKTMFLVAILLVIILGGIGWYYDSRSALFDYLPMYWTLL
ncbi:hypothetical protein GWO43_18420 [candidate division KSB1 bacterium]|nr:hypothetical protein [candidate division KSB1 bacterium]NIR69582.1 hypothetical protein [candidate division KSB1 bacterium]NIS25930.1 hypothetical protein [candidate division KSB1 bacterium]NIT72811.1 hypothetical protein [candidate division KSB1 bacterium]NIU26618.1 hypothetical protein [candidate division KSB1 bacterium]